MGTQPLARDKGKGDEWVARPGGHQVAGGKGKFGNKKNIYVTISDWAYVWRGTCTRFEHHHLIIWTHLTKH